MPVIPPTHWSCRYSNTLFLTLNNRIYFRDHPFPGGSDNRIYQDPTRLPEQNLPQVKPLDIHVVTVNNTFRLDTLSSSVELDKDATSRCWTEGALFVTGIGILSRRTFRYPVIKVLVGCNLKLYILCGIRRQDKPREPVVWRAIGTSLRSDMPYCRLAELWLIAVDI